MVDSRFINNYPYTDFHEMNLDWVITQTETLTQKVDDDKDIIDNVNELKNELKNELGILKKQVEDFDTLFIQKQVEEYIAKTIKTATFGISSAGYFMAIIPSNWSDIEFGTIQSGELYGHLTLNYD